MFSYVFNLLIALILLQLSHYATVQLTPSEFPTCNCIPVKQCEPFVRMLRNSASDDKEKIIGMVHNAFCGFYVTAEPMACCPTTATATSSRARNAFSATNDRWIWDSREYTMNDDNDKRAMEQRSLISNRFATNHFNILTNVIDYEDPETHRNCPHVFYYDNDEQDHDHDDNYHNHQFDCHHHNQQHTAESENIDNDYFREYTVVAPRQKLTSRIIFPDDRRFKLPNVKNKEKEEKEKSAARQMSKKSLTNFLNCGIGGSRRRIHGGNESENGQFPWITRIAYLNISSNIVSYRCSGSIISDQYVVTAAHCVTNLIDDLKLHHVLIGDMANTRWRSNISLVLVHPSYDRPKRANDIALIRLTESVNMTDLNYSPICLPLNNSASFINELTGKTGVVAGWSTNEEGAQITNSPSVKYITLPIGNTTECAINYAKFSENDKEPIVIGPAQLCAQGQPMRDVCRGDSGGPFMDDGTSGLFNSQGRYTLLGIVAFGPGYCGVSNLPGVYTRVSSYVDWIARSLDNK